MEKFTRITAAACPLNVTNINTDQLLPARYLKWPRSAGLGKVLLQDLRFDAQGHERPDFPLNQPDFRAAKIVVAGRNFGCGSSREAAVYALYDYGIRCVIAPSFGDIFAGNAIQNGLLTAAVPDDVAAGLMSQLTAAPKTPVTVDLEEQSISCGDLSCGFGIDPVRRLRLLNGWDDIALTENFREQITAFKTADQTRRAWAIPSD
jgi:3-isopropylmalate/(R)-2-methylmalate dehydratase small subunit